MSATEIEVSEPVTGIAASETPAAIVEAVPQADTIFSVLAGQARRRSTGELRTTAIGCAVNASLLFWQHPSLSWLASAFVAVSVYGVWGLLDRQMLTEESRELPDRVRVTSLRVVNTVVAGVGCSAALWAAFRFMAAALGGWNH